MIYRLESNRPPERFYRGGERITRFRGETPAGIREPEDWIASTTTVFGEDTLGLSRLPGAGLLREAVEADPVHWLGEEHVARWGSDVRLLVKLLDAGQRLPVHAHPDDVFAASRLGRAHGKAEAWYVLEGGTVHVGLRYDISPEDLADLVRTQAAATLLALLHDVTVESGDVVWVPPGELHAIGAGVLLLELQQPEDLSILLEWEGFALDGQRDGHLELGFDVALQAVNHSARNLTDLRTMIRTAPAEGTVFPEDADQYFRLSRHRIDGETRIAPGFAVAVVTRGVLDVDGHAGLRGTTFLIPAGAGDLVVRGAGELLIARPPSP